MLMESEAAYQLLFSVKQPVHLHCLETEYGVVTVVKSCS